MRRSRSIVTFFLVIAYTLLTLLSSLPASFPLSLPPSSLSFDWESISGKYQLYRLLTCLLSNGSFKPSFFLHLPLLFFSSATYEASPFSTSMHENPSADYAWMVCLAALFFPIFAYGYRLSFLSEPFLFLLMYVLSRRFADKRIPLLRVPYILLPWLYAPFYIALKTVDFSFLPLKGEHESHLFAHVSIPLTNFMLGMFLGHCYFYTQGITHYLNNEVSPISTPDWLVRLMNGLGAENNVKSREE